MGRESLTAPMSESLVFEDENLPLLDHRSESRHIIHKKLFEEMDIANKGRVSKIDFSNFLKDLNLAQEVTDRIWIDMHMADRSDHHHMRLTHHEMNHLTFQQFSGYLEELEHSATFWDMVTGKAHVKYEFWANVLLVLATLGEVLYKLWELQAYEILTSFTEFLSACILMNMTIRVVETELKRHRVDLEIIENHCKPHRMHWTRDQPIYSPLAHPEDLEKVIHVLETLRSDPNFSSLRSRPDIQNDWLSKSAVSPGYARTPGHLDPRGLTSRTNFSSSEGEEPNSYSLKRD